MAGASQLSDTVTASAVAAESFFLDPHETLGQTGGEEWLTRTRHTAGFQQRFTGR